jgi:hypothetical protein
MFAAMEVVFSWEARGFKGFDPCDGPRTHGRFVGGRGLVRARLDRVFPDLQEKRIVGGLRESEISET